LGAPRRSNLRPVLRPARVGLAIGFTVSPSLLWTTDLTIDYGLQAYYGQEQ
jgi:hypothetical protein